MTTYWLWLGGSLWSHPIDLFCNIIVIIFLEILLFVFVFFYFFDCHNLSTAQSKKEISISPCRKLRDEYDKLEGALRRLGVDPEAVVRDAEEADEEDFDEDDDLGGPSRSMVGSSSGTLGRRGKRKRKVQHQIQVRQDRDLSLLAELDPLQQQQNNNNNNNNSNNGNVRGSTAVMPADHLGRMRHLDILEEVRKRKKCFLYFSWNFVYCVFFGLI